MTTKTLGSKFLITMERKNEKRDADGNLLIQHKLPEVYREVFIINVSPSVQQTNVPSIDEIHEYYEDQRRDYRRGSTP